MSSWPMMDSAATNHAADRHQLDDEGVAQHRGHEPDRKPGQPELGGDHQQIAAARPGRVIHHHAGDDHQQGEHRRRGARDHHPDEVPERQRPAHRQRRHVDAVANRGFRRIGDAGRGQDQAELQVEPGRGDFRPDAARGGLHELHEVFEVHVHRSLVGKQAGQDLIRGRRRIPQRARPGHRYTAK